MDGPAKSRLRKHLELAREYVNLYKEQKNRAVNGWLGYTYTDTTKYLELAEFHYHTAKEIYEVIYKGEKNG